MELVDPVAVGGVAGDGVDEGVGIAGAGVVTVVGEEVEGVELVTGIEERVEKALMKNTVATVKKMLPKKDNPPKT